MGKAFLYGIGGGGQSTVLSAVTLSSNGVYYPAQFSVDGFSEVTVDVSGSVIFTLSDFDFIFNGDIHISTNIDLTQIIRLPNQNIFDVYYSDSHITGAYRKVIPDVSGTFYANSVTKIFFDSDSGNTQIYSLFAPVLNSLTCGGATYLHCNNIYAPNLTYMSGAIFGSDTFEFITGKLTSIGNSVFYSCRLYSNYIDATDLRYVGNRQSYIVGPDRWIFGSNSVTLAANAFSTNTVIREIVINTTKIPTSCFYNCPNLYSLKLTAPSVTELANTNAFTGTCLTANGGYLPSTVRGIIWVPESLYSSYIVSTNWILYSSRFMSY